MAPTATVFVYEFFTGGGSPSGDLQGGLASEALGMLWAVLTDFSRWKSVRTLTALDPRFEERIPHLNRTTLPADEVIFASPGDHETAYHSLLRRCDAALIIAPETNGILEKLTSQAEAAGIPVLGSSASAVAAAASKSACGRLFRKAGLPVPETHAVRFATARQAAKQMSFPLVIKPVDGAGSEGVCRVDSLSELPAALARVRRATRRDRILLQSLISGVHASVSLLVAKGRCLPLSLNRQMIETGSTFRYRGSEVPFYHEAGECALELARSAVSLIPGLNGYAGVDLILEGSRAWLIEINPRLTTSYIGLRQVAGANLARAIWGACIEGVLPDHVPLAGRVVIEKNSPDSWGLRPGDKR